MEFSRIKSITISHLDFQSIMNRSTRNPIAESDVPEMLLQALQSGVQVLITDPLGRESCELILEQPGVLKYVPLSK